MNVEAIAIARSRLQQQEMRRAATWTEQPATTWCLLRRTGCHVREPNYSSSNSGTKERMLRSNTAPLDIRIRATQTSPSAPGLTSTTLPNLQDDRGMSSWITTTSSIFKFFKAIRQRGRCCIWCKYSHDQTLQNADKAAWSSFQRTFNGAEPGTSSIGAANVAARLGN